MAAPRSMTTRAAAASIAPDPRSMWDSGVSQLRGATFDETTHGLTTPQLSQFINGVNAIGDSVIQCNTVIAQAKQLLSEFAPEEHSTSESKVEAYVDSHYPTGTYNDEDRESLRGELTALVGAIFGFNCVKPRRISGASSRALLAAAASLNMPPRPPSNFAAPPANGSLHPPPTMGGRRTRRRVHRKSSKSSKSRRR